MKNKRVSLFYQFKCFMSREGGGGGGVWCEISEENLILVVVDVFQILIRAVYIKIAMQ